jgi:hypothetical protein
LQNIVGIFFIVVGTTILAMHETKSIASILDHVSAKDDKSTLVIFDIDETILTRYAQKNFLVEDKAASVIEQVQKTCCAMALTARLPHHAKYTADLLKKFGISFKESFFRSAHTPTPSYVHHGVACCGMWQDKGSVLIELFKHYHYTPRKIMYADDRLDHLERTKDLLESFDKTIEFIGIHYTRCLHAASYQHSSENNPIDRSARIEYQD